MTLKAHGQAIAWSGACSGASCGLTVDHDAAVTVTEQVTWQCVPGA